MLKVITIMSILAISLTAAAENETQSTLNGSQSFNSWWLDKSFNVDNGVIVPVDISSIINREFIEVKDHPVQVDGLSFKSSPIISRHKDGVRFVLMMDYGFSESNKPGVLAISAITNTSEGYGSIKMSTIQKMEFISELLAASIDPSIEQALNELGFFSKYSVEIETIRSLRNPYEINCN